jgi:hypothetical protein
MAGVPVSEPPIDLETTGTITTTDGTEIFFKDWGGA